MFESIKNKEIKQRRYFKLILGLFISVYYLQNLVNNEKLTQDLMIQDFQYIHISSVKNHKICKSAYRKENKNYANNVVKCISQF